MPKPKGFHVASEDNNSELEINSNPTFPLEVSHWQEPPGPSALSSADGAAGVERTRGSHGVHESQHTVLPTTLLTGRSLPPPPRPEEILGLGPEDITPAGIDSEGMSSEGIALEELSPAHVVHQDELCRHSPVRRFEAAAEHSMAPDRPEPVGFTAVGAGAGYSQPYATQGGTSDLQESCLACFMRCRECRLSAKEALKRYVKTPAVWSMRCAARWPCTCVLALSVVVITFMIVGLSVMTITVESNFEAFLKTDIDASIERDAFWAAVDSRPGGATPGSSSTRRLSTAPYTEKDLWLAYELTDEATIDNLLHERALAEIASYEMELRQLPGWVSMCGRSEKAFRALCEPGVSITGYTLPTMSMDANGAKPEYLLLDGLGWDQLPFSTTVNLLEKDLVDKVVLPVDFDKTKNTSILKEVRSAFRFRIQVGTYQDSSARRKELASQASKDWKEFALDTIFPAVADTKSTLFKVYYDGSDFSDYEINKALGNDMLYVIGSVSFVFLYLLFHTRSFLLTIVGLIITLISVPFAYVLTGIFTSTSTVNFTSFLAIFLVVGFGCDVIFVYCDFWVDSARHCDSVEDRLVWTYLRAGRASFVTTATTALSFFANMVSVIRALRQFGFFMGLCVMLCWSLISFIFVPLCVVDEYKCGFCRVFAKDVGKNRSAAMTALANQIRRWRKTCLIVPTLLLVVFLVLFIILMETSLGVPEVFPDGHNRVYGQDVLNRFVTPGSTPFASNAFPTPEPMRICSESNFSKRTAGECSLHWCETQTDRPIPLPNTCDCYRSTRTNQFGTTLECAGTSKARVVQRFVAPESWEARLMSSGGDEVDPRSTQGILEAYIAATAFQTGINLSTAEFQSAEELANVVVHEWESGLMTHMHVFQRITDYHKSPEADVLGVCGFDDICYCEVQACLPTVGNWVGSPQLSLPDTQRRLSAVDPRLLAADARRLATVPYNKRIKVRVAFGIEVDVGMNVLGAHNADELWSFLPRFEMRQPWAQRNMYEFCDRFPSNLKVARKWCWINNFRSWLIANENRFPVPSHRFDDLAAQFIASGMSSTKGTKYLWYQDDTVKAMYFSIEVHVNKKGDFGMILDYKKNWDSYVDTYNAAAVLSARGAFHVSKTWVEAGSQAPLIRSAVMTLVILLTLAFLGMLLFTRSVLLSLYVVFATIVVVIGLGFFIVVVMRWKIGLLEVIAIVYFIGYAVTYSLHIAHKYGSSEAKRKSMLYQGSQEGLPATPVSATGFAGAGVGIMDPAMDYGAIRFQRTLFAMQTLGGAALGSAATTAGSAVFLVFCTLTIFQRLGSMCLIVTLLSIVTALMPLPAGLMMFAPIRPGVCCCDPVERLSRTEKSDVEDSSSRRSPPGQPRRE